MKAIDLFRFLIKLALPIALLYLFLHLVDDVFYAWLIAIVLGGIEAWVIWKFLFPVITDLIGDFFFTPGGADDSTTAEEVERLTDLGKTGEALELLEADLRKHPRQLHVHERYIAYLIDPLARYDQAATVLTELGRSRRWSKEVRARLLFRAGHLRDQYLHQPNAAQDLWQDLIRRYPKTVYAQSAKDKLRV